MLRSDTFIQHYVLGITENLDCPACFLDQNNPIMAEGETLI